MGSDARAGGFSQRLVSGDPRWRDDARGHDGPQHVDLRATSMAL